MSDLLRIINHLLQKLIGYEMMSMMDGFLRYNQGVIKEFEQYTTAFTTPWGTYVYMRMSFGLKNASSTF